jgi:hypothetical protein
MDDRLRSRIETEAAAQLEWGHPTDEIVANLVRLGATSEESEQIVHRLTTQQRQRSSATNKLVGTSGALLVLVGVGAIAVNKGVIRYIWGSKALIAEGAPQREGVGPFEFVLAYLFGNSGFFIGACAILLGLLALGHFLSGALHERQRAGRGNASLSSKF